MRIQRRHVLGLVAVLLAALLLLAACGNDDDSGSNGGGDTSGDTNEQASDGTTGGGADDVELCSLLEPGEIEALFGGTVSDGTEELGQCTWEVGEDQSQPDTGTVHVSVVTAVPTVSAEEQFADLEASSQDSVEVSGVGDAAYYEPSVGVLNVRSGDTIFWVQAVFIPEPDDMQSNLEDLAADVVDRL